MKTIGDLQSFLKRKESLPVEVSYTDGKFTVKTHSIKVSGKYLDDALDNMAEEYRRRANEMEPMRDANKNQSSGQTAAPPTAPASPRCSSCGGKGYVMGNGSIALCACYWSSVKISTFIVSP